MKASYMLIDILLVLFSFCVGYRFGISAPEPKETRELEKQLKIEELKKLRLNNEAMKRALFGEEIK